MNRKKININFHNKNNNIEYSLEDLSKEEKLLYDIIFSDKTNFEISYMDFISDIKLVKLFTDDIIEKLEESGIEIDEQAHILTSDQKIWALRIKR